MSADNYIITNQNTIHFLTFTVADRIDTFISKDYSRFEFAEKFDNRIKNYKF